MCREQDEIDIDDSILDTISPEEIDQMLKEADKVEVGASSLFQMQVPRLDMSGIKQIMLELEKLINTNQKMRLKYASEPLKSIFLPCCDIVDLKRASMLFMNS